MLRGGYKRLSRGIVLVLAAVASGALAQMRSENTPLQSRCRPHFDACIANSRLSEACRAWQACENYADLGTTIRRELRFHQLRQPEPPTPSPETQRRVPPTAAGDILPPYRGASQVRPEFERSEKPAEPAR